MRMVAKKKVVAIKRENPIDGSMVRTIRSCLKSIEAGEVTSVAIVWTQRDEATCTAFKTKSNISMLGACDLLKQRVLDQFEKRTRD